MSLQNYTDFKLPKDAYLSFDANSLKELIIERLNENEVFTDQNFEGSNFNAFIDVVSYMYHVLLFYLNTTSNEGTFTTATIYENINKIVSNLGYKPLGDQTSILNISLEATGLNSGVYTIPKFSLLNVGSITYHTLQDILFEKTNGAARETLEISNDILYQGSMKEATFTASGEEYETFTLIDAYTSPQIKTKITNTANNFIADNSFVVYVRDSVTGGWSLWEETTSLFTSEPFNSCYEKRFNHDGNYEFKFGDGNNGRSLKAGDTAVIFYLVSDGEAGIIGKTAINGKNFNLYSSTLFDQIKSQLYTNTDESSLIVPAELPLISTSNQYASTPIRSAETVDEIKKNAPKMFSAQDRLVSKQDYENLINREFNNVTRPVKVLSNDEYTSQVLLYYNKIGLSQGIDDSRTLLAQVNFSTSTNFNNIYVYTVRTNEMVIDERLPNYLNEGQKRLIVDYCNDKKDITHNVVLSDPIFKAFSFGVGEITDTNTIDDIVRNTFLRVDVDRNVAISDAGVRSKIAAIFKAAFINLNLGDLVDIAQITRDILNIDGVEGIETVNGNNVTPNLSFVIWNPDYRTQDSVILTRDYKLQNFEYGYYYGISDIPTNIDIRRI